MLRPRKHLSKKELKEDKLVIFYAKATAWLENYKTYLIAGVAAVIVLALGIFFYYQSSQSSEKNASVELAKATRVYENGNVQSAIPMLSNLVKSYGRTASGKIARFYLANAFFQTKDYDNAKINYQKFIDSFSGDEHFQAAAHGGLAASLEEKKQYAEAAAVYGKAAEKYADTVHAPLFLFKAARCYQQAGKPDQSKVLLQRIVDKYPKSAEKDEAVLQLAMLEQ
ncbi:tetratricopeptide repeat protein [bacterium]|nr:tetratricopeptide repeat protein [bacterium]